MSHGSPAAGARSIARLVVGYAALVVISGGIIAGALTLGGGVARPVAVSGTYRLLSGSSCLGTIGDSIQLQRAGSTVDLSSGATRSSLQSVDDRISGDVRCQDGSTQPVSLRVTGSAGGSTTLDGQIDSERLTAESVDALAEGAGRLSPEAIFGRLMLAIAAVIIAARLVGAGVARIGQPRVMGEVLAGICLGPTLLGALLPDLQGFLFPTEIQPLLVAVADVGLVFYMFLVGLELDPAVLRGRMVQATFISHASIAIPMALGMATAVALFGLFGPDAGLLPFAVFIGVSMSITAFPVLARILIERRMLARPVGAIAIAAAAIDDVTAWGLLAFASAIADPKHGSPLEVVRIVFLTVAFTAIMLIVVRRLLGRVSTAYDEAGHVPPSWIAAIFVGVLLSAYTASAVGVAAIFGAFVMGLVMPRRADLTHDVRSRVEDLVTIVLLPLFFAVIGIRTQVGLLDRWELWAVALLLLFVAVVAKWTGAMAAAKFTGMSLRESAAVGTLMNTRGLTELIVLGIGMDLGILNPTLFTMLVLMALVTTFMTGPALQLIDRQGTLRAPVEDELTTGAGATLVRPPRSIIVAPQDDKNLDGLLDVARLLARTDPPHELILARLVAPPPVPSGPSVQYRRLREALQVLDARRVGLKRDGIEARAIAFTSADIGADLVQLTRRDEIKLILVDGRRRLLGEGLSGGAVRRLLEEAPCDVAVLIGRDQPAFVAAGRVIAVPFGGGAHDWAALELGAWLAAGAGATLRLVGAARPEGPDASRLLASASLLVQRLTGVRVDSALVSLGEGILEAARDADLVVVGLSERWRNEGLGPVRLGIAGAVAAPILFVRRGRDRGALAPSDDVSNFTWSSPGRPARAGEAAGADQDRASAAADDLLNRREPL